MSNFTVSSFGGTVVGLLFTKTGSEICDVVTKKVNELDDEVADLKEAISDVDEFLENKEDDLEKLTELYSNRHDEKDAQARPFRRQVDEIHKAWSDKEFEFNRETERLVGEKAVVFENGFKDFSERFEEIDEIAEQVEDDAAQNPTMFVHAASAADASDGSFHLTSTDRMVGTSILRNTVSTLPTEQDKAAAKLSTLRSKVFNYRDKIMLIKNRINVLEDEADELRLISRHLRSTQEYTLDLDRLVSLGFEASKQ